MRTHLLPAALVAALLPAPASAHQGEACHTKGCVKRVVARWHRAEMLRYKRHPMPYCTWGPESNWDPATGVSFHGRPWAIGRYRVINPSSGAGGKFQIMPTTYHAVGGRGAPHQSPPVVQERLARRIWAWQGPQAWVNC
jgi:Transglycosylase-like domain